MDVRRILRERLQEREEIAFAYLHGSFAEGLPYHDIDVGVYVYPEFLEGLDVFDYETELSVELTSLLKKDVDVRVLNRAPLGFQYAVLQGELLFTRDEKLLTDFIERVGWDYMQFSHLLREYLFEVMR